MIVCTGDTHLAPCAWVSLPDVKGDSYRSFEQIVDFTIANKASALVLAGDVFDARPPAPTIHFFIEQTLRLQAAKIPLYAIQGQHGRDREISWTEIYPYAQSLHGKVIEMEPGVFVSGFDNMPPENLKAALLSLDPHVNLLVLHQMCRGAVPEIQGCQRWDFDPEWCPVTVKLVLMGDLHENWECTLQRDGFSTRAIYVGSTCMQSVNEPADKSFLTVENIATVAYSKELVVRREFLKTRPFQKVVVLSQEAMPIILKTVQRLPVDSLCLLRFDPRVVAVEAQMRVANPVVHFKVEPLSIVNEMEKSDLAQDAEVSLESCLNQVVNRDTDTELHSFILSLLKSKEPKDVLVVEREKRLKF